MAEKLYYPEKIYIEKGSLDFSSTRKILKNASSVPFEVIKNPDDLVKALNTSKDPISEAKKYLLITRQMGEFVKPCPCTTHCIGCNYFIINLYLNCPLDCSYCILQNYLSNPFISVHVNLQKLWDQLDEFIKAQKGRAFRIGTGELSDSLALDHLTEYSRDLISYFRMKKNVLFEFKTKTVNIQNILDIEPAENIIIAWSLNTSKVSKEEETIAPSVVERIEAAKEAVKKGYRVAFHFDPIIRYPEWEEDYGQTICLLLKKVNPLKIAWISLGSLRFPPNLKKTIQERFPHSKITYEELVPGIDGKLRYFKPLRIELYMKLVKNIRLNKKVEKVPLYFCMETDEVWRKVLKMKPKGKKDVEDYLSRPLVFNK